MVNYRLWSINSWNYYVRWQFLQICKNNDLWPIVTTSGENPMHNFRWESFEMSINTLSLKINIVIVSSFILKRINVYLEKCSCFLLRLNKFTWPYLKKCSAWPLVHMGAAHVLVYYLSHTHNLKQVTSFRFNKCIGTEALYMSVLCSL